MTEEGELTCCSSQDTATWSRNVCREGKRDTCKIASRYKYPINRQWGASVSTGVRGDIHVHKSKQGKWRHLRQTRLEPAIPIFHDQHPNPTIKATKAAQQAIQVAIIYKGNAD